MEVHYDEGVAIHIGPEPCVAVREGGSEASAGERIGQPLSRERTITGRRRCFWSGRPHGGARHRERVSSPAWSQTLACAEAPRTETERSQS